MIPALLSASAIALTNNTGASLVPKIVTCNDSSQVRKFINAIGQINDRNIIHVPCGAHNWSVSSCDGSSNSFCVDCSNPCGNISLWSNAASAHNIVLSPCRNLISASSHFGVFKFVSVTFTSIVAVPQILTLKTKTTQTSIAVTAQLSSSGLLSCGAFDSSAPPASTSVILLQNFVAKSGVSNITSLTITGLSPVKLYRIYCVTQSSSGVQLSLGTVQKQLFNATTQCCKSIQVNMTATVVLENVPAVNLIKVTVSSPPYNSLNASLVLYKNSTQLTQILRGVFPQSFSLSKSSVGSFLFYSSLGGISSGSYFFQLLVSGPSAAEYQVFYGSNTKSVGLTLSVIGTTSSTLPAPPVPEFTSATMSNDGSSILASFSAYTNRGGLSNVFPCSSLFQFDCDQFSTCRWIDSATISISVNIASSSNCIRPTSPISLRPKVSLKAQCYSSPALCATGTLNWQNVSSVEQRVQAPSSPVTPTVIVSVPPVVSKCGLLFLDISSSSGSGGRPFQNISVQVYSSSGGDLAELQQYLTDNVVFSPPTRIPLGLLQTGYSYNFVVICCNFLGSCGTGSKSVAVTAGVAPIVSISGPSIRTVFPYNQLTIGCTAFTRSCNGTTSVAELSIKWGVVQSLATTTLKSTSLNPSMFILPAYSLSVNTLYQITLRVSSRDSQASSAASVQVYVQSGNIIALIAGEATRYARGGQPVIIDASNSYDQNTGSNQNLLFSWSQTLIFPTLNDTCAGSINKTSVLFGSYVIVPKSTTAGSTSICQITVTVADTASSRSSSATVNLKFLPMVAPLVSLTSNAVNGFINPSSFFRIKAKISLPSESKIDATWGTDALSVQLSSVSLTPISNVLTAGRFSDNYGVFNLYLLLPPNVLSTGSTFQFTLHCSFTSTSDVVTSNSTIIAEPSIVITVNKPPFSGQLIVTPSSGIALEDVFTLSTSQWVSDNLPLFYEFGYSSNLNVDQILQSKSEITYVQSQLPSGFEYNEYLLPCRVVVFDVMSANTTDSLSVTVYASAPFNSSNFASILSSAVSQQGANSVDRTKQYVAFGSYILNEVTCSSSPNCSTLHRWPCKTTPNTCGGCLDGYAGPPGDSNSFCAIANTSSSAGATSCTSDEDCAFLSVCEEGFCAAPSQSCPSNCSSHGSCTFVNLDSDVEVDSCKVTDIHCIATCRCDAAYSYAPDCGVLNSDIFLRQEYRKELIENIYNLTVQENPTAENIVGWINLLSTASQQPGELSFQSLNILYNLCHRILDFAELVELNFFASSQLLTILNFAGAAPTASQPISSGGGGGGERRALLNETADTTIISINETTASNETKALLERYIDSLSPQLVPSQFAVYFLYRQFRICAQASVLSSDSESAAYFQATCQLPQSTLEKGLNSAMTTVSLFSNSSSSSYTSSNSSSSSTSSTNHSLTNTTLTPYAVVTVAVYSIRSYLFDSTGALKSNPIAIRLVHVPSNISTAISASVLIQNSQAVNQLSVSGGGGGGGDDAVKATSCAAEDFSLHSYSCSYGSQISVRCNGTAETILSQCPLRNYSSVCNSIMGSYVVGDSMNGCQVQQYNSDNVTCLCTLVQSTSSTRASSATTVTRSDSSSSFAYAANYVSMLTYTERSFVTTVLSAGSLNSETVSRSWKVLVTIAALVSAFFVLLFLSMRWDYRDSSDRFLGAKKSDISFLASMNDTIVSYMGTFSRSNSAMMGRNHRKQRGRAYALSRSQSELSIVERSLPKIMSSKSIFSKIFAELKMHHRWFSIVLYFSEGFPRPLRVISLVSNILSMLFIQSIFYNLANPDEG